MDSQYAAMKDVFVALLVNIVMAILPYMGMLPQNTRAQLSHALAMGELQAQSARGDTQPGTAASTDLAPRACGSMRADDGATIEHRGRRMLVRDLHMSGDFSYCAKCSVSSCTKHSFPHERYVCECGACHRSRAKRR